MNLAQPISKTWKLLRSGVALALTGVLTFDSVNAYGFPATNPSAPSIHIPPTIGFTAESHRLPSSGIPDFVFIQDLHVNRSVQRNISKILDVLRQQKLLPSTVAVEGETGPIETKSMQTYPDARARRQASDYLVSQGEMPGAMHFVVSSGQGSLYGVETPEVYGANLSVLQRTYRSRLAILREIDSLESALPTLRRSKTDREKALQLQRDIEAVRPLLALQVPSNELQSTLRAVAEAVDRLEQVLSPESAKALPETLAGGTNFYALALMRNEDLFQNALALRTRERQTTTVLVAGGFHTEGLAAECRKAGLSYVVVCPQVNEHTAVDERLYVERLLGDHLSAEQLSQGDDWVAMGWLQVIYRTASLFQPAVSGIQRPRFRRTLLTALVTLLPMIPVKLQTQSVSRTPAAAAQQRPADFRTIEGAAQFVIQQRAMDGKGLPLTFRPAPNDRMPNPPAERIVREGVGLYDSALGIIALTAANKFKEARDLIALYQSDFYGPTMELGAYPKKTNRGAFAPFNSMTHYLFNITRADGIYNVQWDQWLAHTGPNAWLATAIAHYVRLSGDRSPDLMATLRMLGDAMILLQDPAAQGGIRYGPQGMFHEPGEADAYSRINSENEVSAYAALKAISRVTGDAKYAQSADRVANFLKNATIRNPKTGRLQKGMMDPETGLLFVDAVWNEDSREWVASPDHATDSGGTWTLSSLSPELIDQLWGHGAAIRMWLSLRQRFGRTDEFAPAGMNGPLAGFDFAEVSRFGSNEGLISPEWTGGGLFAARALLNASARLGLTESHVAKLRSDVSAMEAFFTTASNQTPYAVGPGMRSGRQGRTGWGWFSGRGAAMASIYRLFPFDPLAQGVSIASRARGENESPLREPASEPTTVPTPRETSGLSMGLHQQHSGADYLGYWESVDAEGSKSFLGATSLEFAFVPNQGRLDGFHVDIKGGRSANDQWMVYSLYGIRNGNSWTLAQESDKTSAATVRVEGNKVVVTVPVSEIKASMGKSTFINQLHFQTGAQQNGHSLNNRNVQGSTVVRAKQKLLGDLSRGARLVASSGLRRAGGVVAKVSGMIAVSAAVGGAQESRVIDTVATTGNVLAKLTEPYGGLLFAVASVVIATAGAIFYLRSGELKTLRRALYLAIAFALVGAGLNHLQTKPNSPTPASERPELPAGNTPTSSDTPSFEKTLYDNYRGASWLGYFTKIDPSIESSLHKQTWMRYTVVPSDPARLKGFHVQIDDEDQVPSFGFFVVKNEAKQKWEVEPTLGTRPGNLETKGIRVTQKDNGVVVVDIPMALMKDIKIGIIHGQTGLQQDGATMNPDGNVESTVTVSFFGGKSISMLPNQPDGMPTFLLASNQTPAGRPWTFSNGMARQGVGFHQFLRDNYRGESWLGYYTKLSPSASAAILSQPVLRFVISAANPDRFKGFHIQIDSPDEMDRILQFFVRKNEASSGWKVDVASSRNSIGAPAEADFGKIAVSEGKEGVIVDVPVALLKKGMSDMKATALGILHVQTGLQQQGRQMNEQNEEATVEVMTRTTIPSPRSQDEENVVRTATLETTLPPVDAANRSARVTGTARRLLQTVAAASGLSAAEALINILGAQSTSTAVHATHAAASAPSPLGWAGAATGLAVALLVGLLLNRQIRGRTVAALRVALQRADFSGRLERTRLSVGQLFADVPGLWLTDSNRRRLSVTRERLALAIAA